MYETNIKEPQPFDTRRWRCGYCNKSYAHRSSAVRHGDVCWSNPLNRRCRTCKHCSEDDRTCGVGLNYDDNNYFRSERCESWDGWETQREKDIDTLTKAEIKFNLDRMCLEKLFPSHMIPRFTPWLIDRLLTEKDIQEVWDRV